MFERLLDLRNDLGLLSEEYDAAARRQVGNTPQAFSHVGLVNTARHLQPARRSPCIGQRRPVIADASWAPSDEARRLVVPCEEKEYLR